MHQLNFLLLLAIQVGVQCRSLEELLVRECLHESGVNPRRVADVFAGNIAGDPALVEYLFCTARSYGLQDRTGNFNVGGLLSLFGQVLGDPREAEDFVKKCYVARRSPQEAIYYATRCEFENLYFDEENRVRFKKD